MKDYSNVPPAALLDDFCRRAPDLYMDMLEMGVKLGRQQLIHVLETMDLDVAEGRKGRLLRQPFADESS